ncbi:MAG: shikimate kinase [Desulfotignum sp.]
MKYKKNIALIGMPAVGKSTVGVLLAKKMGFDFMDTDILIQAKEDQTLARIIACHGLGQFLEIEKQHLLNIECARHVIATGGSVIYKSEAMYHLADISMVVYLAIDLDVLKTRLSDVITRGVAISPGKSIDDLYLERIPLYEKYADLTVQCGKKHPEHVVEAIVRSLSGYRA